MMIQTSREGSADGLAPDTLSISPLAGGAPGRSLKRLPSLQFSTFFFTNLTLNSHYAAQIRLTSILITVFI